MNKMTVPKDLTEREKQHLIGKCDDAFDQSLEAIARSISQNEALHLLALTGPTCSGKTTAAEKLRKSLAKRGKSLRVISVDDFYYNKDYLHALAAQNGKEELDYDSEETIDTELLHDCVESLLQGNETPMPRFNFHTGMREAGEVLVPREGDLFLLEGIQILYPKVERILSKAHCQSIYICPMTALETNGELFSPNDLRFLRRIVRDFRFRSTAPEFTFRLWQSVRENEEAHIFPYVGSCQYKVDSTMLYELGILKPYLAELLATLPSDSRYASVGQRLSARLASIQPISAQYLKEQSLYKEFV